MKTTAFSLLAILSLVGTNVLSSPAKASLVGVGLENYRAELSARTLVVSGSNLDELSFGWCGLVAQLDVSSDSIWSTFNGDRYVELTWPYWPHDPPGPYEFAYRQDVIKLDDWSDLLMIETSPVSDDVGVPDVPDSVECESFVTTTWTVDLQFF